MAMSKRVQFLFTKVPPGTHYRKNHYAKIDEEKAKEYASAGYGEEYDPKKKKSASSSSSESKKTSKKDSK